MALEPISNLDTNGKWIEGLPDTPQLDTLEMQRCFDAVSRDAIIPKFNSLVKNLSNNSGAEEIGARAPIDFSGTNIQAILNEIPGYIDQRIVQIGAGDMAQTIYDTKRRRKDIFDTIEKDKKDLSNTIDKHTDDKNNPHNVTASQTGALPTAGGSMSGAIEFEGGGSIQSADSLLKLSNGGNILAVGPDGVTSNGKTIAASEGVTWTPRVEMQGSTQPIRSSSGTAYKVGNIAVITYTITFSQPLSASDALWITGLPYNIPYGNYPLGDYFLDLAVNRINGYMSSDGEGNILVRRMDEPYTYSVMNTAGDHVKDGTIFSGTFVCTVI